MKLHSDRAEIERALGILFPPGVVVEMRIPKTEREGTVSGYFDDHTALAKCLASRNGDMAIYVTLNPVTPALLARAVNRIKLRARVTTSDHDIAQRLWLLIDFDPVRPSEISSTDAEHEAALSRARDIRLVLTEEGWPAPILADSGNGAHLLYRLALPNDEASTKLVERVLKAVAARFDDEQVKIDQTVFNAARIVKAYGTVAAKGDHTHNRPHRLSRILEVPPTIEQVSGDLLKSIVAAEQVEPPATVASSRSSPRSSRFDIEAFLTRYLQARAPVAHDGGRKWLLEECPFSPDHKAPDAAIFERADGAFGFKCLHNSCVNKHWQDVRALFEGPRQKQQRSNRPAPKEDSPQLLPDGAETIPGPRIEQVTLAEVHQKFGSWLHLPDMAPVTITLAAVAANYIEGDPTWPLLVGPPASGKTEILDSILGLPNMHPAGTLTEASLLSGTPGREKASDASGGLLRAIGTFGFIVCKDFTSVLSMSRELRSALLSALREIYDGHWTRHVGTDGGRTLRWVGKAVLIAGVTPIVDQHHAVMAAMGERFLFCRLPDVQPLEQAKIALKHAGQERTMRKQLRDVVTGLFANFEPKAFVIDDAKSDRLSALATLTARCRSAVERDSYHREIELVPGSERPARLVLSLARLYQGDEMHRCCRRRMLAAAHIRGYGFHPLGESQGV